MKSHKVYFIITVFLVSVFLFLPQPSEARKKQKIKRVFCHSAILSDSTRGVRLFSKNINDRVLPASTTKVMTALIVLENLSLDQYVTVGPRATAVQPSRIDVRPGEQYKVKDLLYALLLNSANDASIVLAEAVAGSETKFVGMMNNRARQLGAQHTKFANSNGLPTRISQYTSAYDMYLIFRTALKNNFFRDMVRRRYMVIYSKAGRRIFLKSHNTILFNDWNKKIYGKTGYTRSAQACFVGSLQKGDNNIIVAVFGCTNRWDYIKYIVTKYAGISL